MESATRGGSEDIEVKAEKEDTHPSMHTPDTDDPAGSGHDHHESLEESHHPTPHAATPRSPSRKPAHLPDLDFSVSKQWSLLDSTRQHQSELVNNMRSVVHYILKMVAVANTNVAMLERSLSELTQKLPCDLGLHCKIQMCAVEAQLNHVMWTAVHQLGSLFVQHQSQIHQSVVAIGGVVDSPLIKPTVSTPKLSFPSPAGFFNAVRLTEKVCDAFVDLAVWHGLTVVHSSPVSRQTLVNSHRVYGNEHYLRCLISEILYQVIVTAQPRTQIVVNLIVSPIENNPTSYPKKVRLSWLIVHQFANDIERSNNMIISLSKPSRAILSQIGGRFERTVNAMHWLEELHVELEDEGDSKSGQQQHEGTTTTSTPSTIASASLLNGRKITTESQEYGVDVNHSARVCKVTLEVLRELRTWLKMQKGIIFANANASHITQNWAHYLTTWGVVLSHVYPENLVDLSQTLAEFYAQGLSSPSQSQVTPEESDTGGRGDGDTTTTSTDYKNGDDSRSGGGKTLPVSSLNWSKYLMLIDEDLDLLDLVIKKLFHRDTVTERRYPDDKTMIFFCVEHASYAAMIRFAETTRSQYPSLKLFVVCKPTGPQKLLACLHAARCCDQESMVYNADNEDEFDEDMYHYPWHPSEPVMLPVDDSFMHAQGEQQLQLRPLEDIGSVLRRRQSLNQPRVLLKNVESAVTSARPTTSGPPLWTDLQSLTAVEVPRASTTLGTPSPESSSVIPTTTGTTATAPLLFDGDSSAPTTLPQRSIETTAPASSSASGDRRLAIQGLNIESTSRANLAQASGGKSSVKSSSKLTSFLKGQQNSASGFPSSAIRPFGTANPIPPIDVLIVEDNPINQKILSSFLQKCGVKYEVASNGKEAVELFQKHIIMPVMDGITATRLIRDHEATQSLTHPSKGKQSESSDFATPVPMKAVIVALTASALPEDRAAALNAGCNDYLIKPVSLAWLERKMLEWGSMQMLIDFEQLVRTRGSQRKRKQATSQRNSEQQVQV
ncbi:ssk1 response regulator receiver [Quaeritorhiza haematococci]|nr:ssk1 response regulator receiver [Quaeritorhiza haematococci]